MKTIRIRNLTELESFARALADGLRGGEVVGLVGDLGAGKTALVRAIARALGVKKAVRSPTFVIMQVFAVGAAARRRGLRQLCHVDAYRLGSESELDAVGFWEYVNRPDTVAIVEWADRVPSLHAAPHYSEITIDFGENGDSRELRIGI